MTHLILKHIMALARAGKLVAAIDRLLRMGRDLASAVRFVAFARGVA